MHFRARQYDGRTVTLSVTDVVLCRLMARSWLSDFSANIARVSASSSSCCSLRNLPRFTVAISCCSAYTSNTRWTLRAIRTRVSLPLKCPKFLMTVPNAEQRSWKTCSTHLYIFFWFLPRDASIKRGLSRNAVSVCLSRSYILSKYFQKIFTVG